MRKLVLVTVALGLLALAPNASAAIPNVFTGTATPIACVNNDNGTPANPADDQRQCGSSSPRSTVPTPVDGVPIDINVALPPEPTVGPDGNFPLIIWGHGYGGSKFGFNAMRRFTDRGYAVFSMTTRGFHESCGSAASRTAANPICDDEGYVRLMDTRYEVRDAQEFAGLLNNEGVIDGQRVGAIGGSYGGGLSMALAALRDRKMMTNGSLVPWTSPAPDNDPMRIAGAAPSVPWTDLAYSLLPNGSTLDYVADAPYRGRFGVMKQSLVTGLYVSGQGAPGYYVTAGGDPDADLTTWFGMINAGEPYDGNPLAADILDEVTTHHSSYYVDHSQPPAPLLISSGFTDDLFPADEAVRFYNRTRTQFPGGAAISLYFGNFGHQRGANKAADGAELTARENAWLDHYVKRTGPAPPLGVTTRTQTCPNSAASGGPFDSTNWATATRGEVRLEQPDAQTAVAGAGNDAISVAFNPVSAGQNPCVVQPGADQSGVATYRLPTVTGGGYTLNGSPTVIADVAAGTTTSQLAMRLLDVDPSGGETLVARGALRPNGGITTQQVFQLHPNAWHFAAGHTPKLELLTKDGTTGAPTNNYLRVSNGQGNVSLTNLQLRLPVVERPGANDGAVKAPRPKVVPAGYTLAKDFADLPTGINAKVGDGTLVAKGGKVEVPVGSPDTWEACHAQVEIVAGGTGATTAAKKKKGKKKGKKRGEYVVAAKNASAVAIPGGQTGKVALTLTKQGRKALKKRKRKGKPLTVTVRLTTVEQDGTVTAARKVTLKKGKKKKKRKRK